MIEFDLEHSRQRWLVQVGVIPGEEGSSAALNTQCFMRCISLSVMLLQQMLCCGAVSPNAAPAEMLL
jgi:hypothetical protein